MNSVIRLVKYLQGTICENILYSTIKPSEKPKFDLTGYADVVFDNCIISRKTTGEYLFCLNDVLLTWQSKRQLIVVTFTTKREYIAACNVTKEAVWFRCLFENMGCEQKNPTVLYEDNTSAKFQTENSLYYKKTKYVDIIYHYTR